MRYSFWEQLLEKAQAKTKLHANVSPSHDSWIAAGAGKSGLKWVYIIRTDSGTVELDIDRGPNKKDETDAIFLGLKAHKDQVEKAFGEPLTWDQAQGRRGVHVRSESLIGGWKDEKSWGKLQDDMIGRMMRLVKAIGPHIGKLDV
jgi:hypothetical protein